MNLREQSTNARDAPFLAVLKCVRNETSEPDIDDEWRAQHA